jgi:prevent-host-death family protein
MIQVKISQLKNRLSHYLRLVRGGEQIEIIDRSTPVARIIHVSQAYARTKKAVWVNELQRLGIISPPEMQGFPLSFLSKNTSFPSGKEGSPRVLQALLEERDAGP